MVQDPNEPSAFGLTPNVAAGLASLFAGIGSLVILLGKPPQAWVRFVAVQSIVMVVILIVAEIVLSILDPIILFLPYIGPVLAIIVGLLLFVLGIAYFIAWLIQTIKAFQGSAQRFPIISSWTDRFMPAAANMVASSTYTPPPTYSGPPPPPTYTPPPPTYTPPPPPTPPDTTP
jgi:uncharacterized membrane protein